VGLERKSAGAPARSAGAPVRPAVEASFEEFAAFLRAEKFPFTDAEVAAQRPLLERALRRELARRESGDSEAARVALEGDPVYRRALEVLHRAKTPREVFALAPAASAPGPARPVRGAHGGP